MRRTPIIPGMMGWLPGLVLGWLIALGQPATAQHPHFSQYYAAPLYLNPALAALEKSAYVGLNYRDQWRSLGFSQKTGQLSVVLPVYGRSPERVALGSLGATAYNDVLGENNSFRATGAALSVSRALYNGPAHVVAAGGVQVGLTQKRLDAGGLQWGSQYDPSVGFNPGLAPATAPPADQRVFPVVHAGLLWHYNHFRAAEEPDWSLFAGLAAGNLNRPDESLLGEKSRLPVLYKFHGGLHWRVSERAGVSPNWLVMRQNGAHQVNAGAYFDYTLAAAHRGKPTPLRLSAGAWYRLDDAFIWSVGTACKNYTFGFSYDVNVSSLRYGTAGRGAYEFSLAYRFAKGDTKIRRYATPLM